MAVFEQRLVKIRALRHESRGDSPADKLRRAVSRLEIALELVFVALAPQGSPSFLERDVSHAFEDIVGNARPSVVKAFALPERSELDDVLAIVEFHDFSLSVMYFLR